MLIKLATVTQLSCGTQLYTTGEKAPYTLPILHCCPFNPYKHPCLHSIVPPMGMYTFKTKTLSKRWNVVCSFQIRIYARLQKINLDNPVFNYLIRLQSDRPGDRFGLLPKKRSANCTTCNGCCYLHCVHALLPLQKERQDPFFIKMTTMKIGLLQIHPPQITQPTQNHLSPQWPQLQWYPLQRAQAQSPQVPLIQLRLLLYLLQQ